MSKDNITAVADLTQIIDMTTQPIMVPVTVTCPGIKDKNVEVTPRNIPITIEERESIDCIINTELVPALDIVGKGFEKGTMFLPQL